MITTKVEKKNRGKRRIVKKKKEKRKRERKKKNYTRSDTHTQVHIHRSSLRFKDVDAAFLSCLSNPGPVSCLGLFTDQTNTNL